jgi:hypothetical protein
MYAKKWPLPLFVLCGNGPIQFEQTLGIFIRFVKLQRKYFLLEWAWVEKNLHGYCPDYIGKASLFPSSCYKYLATALSRFYYETQ